VFEAEPDPSMPKYFINFPYPYMNGYLHIGHAFSLMRCEALARFKRMRGCNVLWPFSFHCTGTPIVAAAGRVKNGEKKQLEILRSMGVPGEMIPRFADPVYWTEFFPGEARADLVSMGLSADWRRSFITTTLNPFYSRFVEWQFLKLREKGYVKKGEFPVVWCPNCGSAVGDHARLKGEGERPQEFTLLKFEFEDEEFGRVFIMAATLRPETVFGQTNLWVDPGVEYVVVRVDGEKWIVSEPCAKKLGDQQHEVEVVGTRTGRVLMGKHAIAPVIHRPLMILPSAFCDPWKGTGIVTSVPSDAPDDWMGLHDLQQDTAENRELLREYGLDIEELREIEPIPIIESKDLGTCPAVKLCRRMGIRNQHERDKLEAAKKEIYRSGFYTGKMTDVCGPEYVGRPVEEVKNEMRRRMMDGAEAVPFYELSGPVVCRCLTPSGVKIVTDQWFLDYSNPGWKREVHRLMDERTALMPELVRKQFHYVIDWLNNWACTREFGLGTPLPWDHKWLIESLSDSTIYMAFYTISGYFKGKSVIAGDGGVEDTGDADGIEIGELGRVTDESAAQRIGDLLDEAFFDYVFLGKGEGKRDPDALPAARVFPVRKMREEFEYWYPFDFRGSGKDLVQNHLTFCMFNHAAVFPGEKFPRGFGVNGWIKVEGEKMSKSRGNFFTLRQVIREYGSDVVRMGLAAAGEGVDDPNWEIKFVESLGGRLAQWYEFAVGNYHEGAGAAHAGGGEKGGTGNETGKEGPGNSTSPVVDTVDWPPSDPENLSAVDLWFLSRLNRIAGDTRELMERTLFKSAVKRGYFDLQNDFRWYLRRCMGQPNPAVQNLFIEWQTAMLMPFVPHLCSEIMEKIGLVDEKGLPTCEYPEPMEFFMSEAAEESERYLGEVMEDIRRILKVTGIRAQRICLYLSPAWKYEIYRMALEEERPDVGTLMKKAMANPGMRKYGKAVKTYVLELVKNRPVGRNVDEGVVLRSAKGFLEKEFGCSVDVFASGDEKAYDPVGKSRAAAPFRPAIYVE